MKRYKVTKTYIIQAENDLHLQVILNNLALNYIERYCIAQDIKPLRNRAQKKRWNPWLAAFGRNLKYLVVGK